LNRKRTPIRNNGPEIIQLSPLLVTSKNNAKKMNRVAPTPSHRHAMINAMTMRYVGTKWISRARIVSPKPLPSLNTSKANTLKNNAKRMHSNLGLQKRTRLGVVFIGFS
jgi:hypothetical protein